MKTETVQERMQLLERLLSRSTIDPVHNVPLPAPSPWRSCRADDVSGAWRRLRSELDDNQWPGHYLNLYVHVPFCPTACTFCAYDHELDDAPARRGAYLDFLQQQIDYFAPLVDGTRCQNLLIGGGTPTRLDTAELERLLETLRRHFRFADGAVQVIESNPQDLTPEKTALLRDYGLQKASIGVHSMDPTVLERHERSVQTADQVEAAVENLRSAGVAWVDCDLMLGLVGSTGASIVQGVEAGMGFAPDTIALTRLRPSQSYLDRHFAGDIRAFVRFRDDLHRAVIAPLSELAASRGYAGDDLAANRLAWTLRARGFDGFGDPARPYQTMTAGTIASTLGLGRFARGMVCGALIYEHTCSAPVFDRQAPHFRAVRTDRRYEMARWLIGQIVRGGTVSKQGFADRFRVALDEAFPFLVAALQHLGQLEDDDGTLRFAAADERRRFVVSRLFLPRQAAIQELSMEDWDVLTLEAGKLRLQLRVDHLRADRPDYLATAGSVGLLVERSSHPGSATETVVLSVMQGLLRRSARARPWLSALEVADLLAAQVPALLAERLTVRISRRRAG